MRTNNDKVKEKPNSTARKAQPINPKRVKCLKQK